MKIEKIKLGNLNTKNHAIMIKIKKVHMHKTI